MYRTILALVFFAFFVAAPVRAAGNLVVNGGFEAGDFSVWSQSGNTDLSFVFDDTPHSGAYAAWLGPTDTPGFLAQMLITVPGQLYNISYWLRHEPFGTGTPSLFQLYWDGGLLGEQTDPGTFAYTNNQHLSVLATGASTELKFSFREDTDYFQFDDVTVTPVPEPRTLWMLVAGLAVVLGCRARHFRAGAASRRLARHGRAQLLAIAALGLSALGMVPPVQAQGITDLSFKGLQKFLADNTGVRSPRAFLENLLIGQPEFGQHWIMMTHSESAQTGNATSPRFILPNAQATAVFGFALDSDSIEYIRFDAATKRFRFHAINTDTGTLTGTETDDDASCLACHASTGVGIKLSRPRPNWDAYDSWGGMLPFNRDRLYQDSIEADAFARLLFDLRNNPIVKQLPLPKGVTRDATTGAVSFAFAPCDTPGDGGVNNTAPCKTDDAAGRREDVTYDHDTDEDLLSFPGPLGPINVDQGGKYVRLHHSLEGDVTDQGRAVRLFDNFSDLNALRVAQEIIDFPRKPVDIRYIALAIANQCVNETTLGKFAPKKSLVKMLAHHTGIEATVKTFGDLLADTRKRQKSLPRMKADLQARNLKGLLLARGDPAAPELVVPEIARRSVEGYRRAEEALFMVDREIYNETDAKDNVGVTRMVALFRLFLEPLGVGVDTWSMSVNSIDTNAARSTTYTFGDVLDPKSVNKYIPAMLPLIAASMAGEPVDPASCNSLAVASVKQYAKGF